jgi:3-oxoacyl-[acyl-carrier-protein] synthase I
MPPFVARVIGVGLACPVGLRSAPALAAMRAGITRIVERDDVEGPGGPARAHTLSTLEPQTPRLERILALARHALREAVANLRGPFTAPVRCLVALPEPGLGPRIDPDPLARGLGLTTAEGDPIPLELGPHTVFDGGRAGAFQALEAALAVMAVQPRQLCVVGGVDSRVDPVTLAALAARNRLLGATNIDGVIPGEGAAFVLLGHPSLVDRRHALAHVVATRVAQEPIPFDTAGPRVSASLGLAAVFRALRTEHAGRVDELFAGTTGEVYFGRELSHAYLRNEPLMPEPMRAQTLGSLVGDVGAAAGAMSLVQAIASLQPSRLAERPPPNQTALAYGSSDGGIVGGCIVAR